MIIPGMSILYIGKYPHKPTLQSLFKSCILIFQNTTLLISDFVTLLFSGYIIIIQ